MAKTVEELEELIKELRWENFEAEIWGQIAIGKIMFAMRVGLYMDRPTQAIMAHGQFVRMRSAEFWKDYKLARLDPESLFESLYFSGANQVDTRFYTVWQPKEIEYSKTVAGQSAAMNIQQIQPTAQMQPAQQLYAQTLGGYGHHNPPVPANIQKVSPTMYASAVRRKNTP